MKKKAASKMKKTSNKTSSARKNGHINHIVIGNKKIGSREPIYIVAEIGINHNGNLAIVKQLIDEAARAGADAVKFQKRTVSVVYSPEELAKPRPVEPSLLLNAIKRGVLPPEAVKRLQESNFENSTNGDLKYALELTEAEYKEIDRYAKEKGIQWFASCWDEDAVDFIAHFNPPVFKIASASLTDSGLLRHTKAKGKPIILSTGMSDIPMIERAVETIGKDNLVLMHTVSTYPANPEDVNLSVIQTLRDKFGVPVGYSGHEVGLTETVAAAVLGAPVIERHFTLDRAMWGSDHSASVEPIGLERLVKRIRAFERARGDGVKRIIEAEKPVMQKLRRKHS